MQEVSKGVAWMCIFSMLYLGCYSSTIVGPTDNGKVRLLSNRILFVVTKDSVKYIFDKKPIVVNDTIVGEFRSIPISNVSYASIADKERTLPARIDYVVTKDGTRYDFDCPPKIINGQMVGDIALSAGDAPWSKSVVIPLSDVGYASDSTDTTNWITWGVVGVAIAAVSVGVVYLAFSNRGW
jgi:hypothetical protein